MSSFYGPSVCSRDLCPWAHFGQIGLVENVGNERYMYVTNRYSEWDMGDKLGRTVGAGHDGLTGIVCAVGTGGHVSRCTESWGPEIGSSATPAMTVSCTAYGIKLANPSCRLDTTRSCSVKKLCPG
jgi:hypothetical protein